MVKLGDAAVAHGAVFGPDGLPYLQGEKKEERKKQKDIAGMLLVQRFHLVCLLTKQVLQKMLRSRLPVSASSTIV